MKFPKDYADKEVAGKSGEFTIKIVAVQEKKIPPVPSFLKQLGDFENEEALRADLRKRLEHDALEQAKNDAYGKAGLDGVNLALSGLNLKPVAQATVERNSVDVDAAVKAIVAAAPDAVVQISAYKSCAAFIRAARKAGYGGTFYNVSFVGTQALADELGKEAAGVVVSQVVPSPYNAASPLTREFVDAVKKAGGEAKANFSSMEGYLAAKVLVEGLKRASSHNLTRESLISGLESLSNQSFGGFSVSFSSRNHVASSFVDVSMLTGDGRVRT